MLKPAGLPPQISALERTAVFGVLNVTPDSFSDGGMHSSTIDAVTHGLALMQQGADVIDVGGESTRPGAERVSEDEELARVIPVIKELVNNGATVSIDTMRSQVAREAVQSGAQIVNDVSGGLADANMFKVVAELQVPYILMHWRGHSTEMEKLSHYQDVTVEVISELQTRIQAAEGAGISLDYLVVDPGIGFAKNSEHNWSLLKNLEQFQNLKCPLLIGASRKRFIGELLADEQGPRDVLNRDFASTALTTVLAERNVWAVRVHQVQAARDAIAVIEALRK